MITITRTRPQRAGSLIRFAGPDGWRFVVFETVAGFRASSLALLSDAGHNFADAFALLLAAFGFYLQSRPARSRSRPTAISAPACWPRSSTP